MLSLHVFIVLIVFENFKASEGISLKTLEFNFTDPEILGGAIHHCYRDCKKGENKECFYRFVINQDITMSESCGKCPFERNDCFLPGCISAGGKTRPVTVVNHMIPGPSIQVCEGDTVRVSVLNKLGTQTSSIHWHGIHQYGTPFMDGVPYITQCPILPNNKFIYEFKASPSGTLIWHAHSGYEEADGLFGILVARKADDPLKKYYDFDLAEHVMIVWHWFDDFAESKLTFANDFNGKLYGYGLLINGLASHATFVDSNGTFETPREIFHVNSRKRYRFRVIYNSAVYCPIQISVDNHKLLAIASETGAVKPVEVDTFVISSGERYDFVLEANQKPGNYWIRYRSLKKCRSDDDQVSEAAILHYNEVKAGDPIGTVFYNDASRHGILLNPVELLSNHYENNTVIRLTDLESLEKSEDDISGIPDHTIYLKVKANSYKLHSTTSIYPQINDVSLAHPPSPLVSQIRDIPPDIICNDGNRRNEKCVNEFCKCLSIHRVKKNSLVEMVFVDAMNDIVDQDHPFHLHGHDFYVVAMEPVDSNLTVEYVKDLNEKGLIKRNLLWPLKKDNINIVSRGMTIVRFIAYNPGYWLMHCHLTNHMDMGMALILKVGNDSEMFKVPADFPKCGDFGSE